MVTFSMERRRSDRIRIHLKAEYISIDVRSAVFIGNLSENGICIQTVPSEAPVEFISGTTAQLHFQLPSGKTFTLNCEVRWAYKNPPDGLTSSVGMEITDPISKYKEFVKTFT